ncbi:MAG TPA: hypothetical protein VL688_06675 [Verrucomicrobiae bacterium]|nr:hypothetical protein [Verrucomicrobiae bacterium]
MNSRKMWILIAMAAALVFFSHRVSAEEEPKDVHFSDDWTGYTDTEEAKNLPMADMEQAGEEDTGDVRAEETLPPEVKRAYADEQ